MLTMGYSTDGGGEEGKEGEIPPGRHFYRTDRSRVRERVQQRKKEFPPSQSIGWFSRSQNADGE